eukprot:COSAG05_NODE_51_length_23916_cov_18.924931_12_plen_884_part_00
MPAQLDGMLQRRAYVDYVKRLNWALQVIMGDDMANIGALVDLRDQLLERKNAVHQILLERLQNYLFLRQAEDSTSSGVDSKFDVTNLRDVRPRLPVDVIAQQYHSVRRQLAIATTNDDSSGTRVALSAASGMRASNCDALLQELVEALDASLVAPLDVSYERIVKSLKLEIKRMVDEAADTVSARIRTQQERDTSSNLEKLNARTANKCATSAMSEDGLHRPDSQGLVELLETVHQTFIVVFFNLVRFSSCCEHVGGSVYAKENRMFALAETWRDMQNTIELYVLKHLQEPRAAGEGSYTTQELFTGTFHSKLAFSFGAQTTHSTGTGLTPMHSRLDNDEYAGSDFVESSPYHIMNIYSPLMAFADTGFELLAATGMDVHLARGSHLLPTFVDDFVTQNFSITIVEETNRLCSIAVQAADAFMPPPTPSRVWRPNRQPLKSCMTVVRLIETLYDCVRAIPAHADTFVLQINTLLTRYVRECRRQVELGCRNHVAYTTVCPSTSREEDSGSHASAAALAAMLQNESNQAWRSVVQARARLHSSGKADGAVLLPPLVDLTSGGHGNAVVFTDDEAEAMFRSEFAALSAAVDQHEAATSSVIQLLPEDQFVLLTNFADSLAYLCECVQSHERSIFRLRHQESSKPIHAHVIVPGENAENGKLRQRRSDASGWSDSLSSCKGRAHRTLLVALGYSDESPPEDFEPQRDTSATPGTGLLTTFGESDDETVSTMDTKSLCWAIRRCWMLHDSCLLVLRLELRCACISNLRRTRDATYNLSTAPVNPEEFVVGWNRLLQRLSGLLSRYLPSDKHTFVISGLPSTMAAILEHYSGVHDGSTAFTTAGVMQMRRNIFALQQAFKSIYARNSALLVEDIFLDRLDATFVMISS